MRLARVIVAMWVTTLVAGCAAYQFGTRSLYRPDIRTVHVPMFQSETFRRDLGEQLTEAVVKEIELRTPYKVVDAVRADSVLSGRLLSLDKRVLAEDSLDQARDLEVYLTVEVSWIDRRGQDLMRQIPAPRRNFALQIGQSTSFVPESGQSMATAQQVAIRRLAQQIVSQMELRW